MRLHTRPRNGTILPFLAVTIVAILSMIALGIDVGLMAVTRTEAQDIADLSALAGTRQFNGDTTNSGNLNNWTGAVSTASTEAYNNKIFKDPNNPLRGVAPTTFSSTKGIYSYNSGSQRFVPTFPGSPGSEAWSTMKVNVAFNMPTYFGRVMGINSYTASASATAAHRPRDVALILDYSGSMRFGCESGFWQGQSQDVRGSLNPDPVYPKFGHYLSMSQRTITSTSTQNTPSGNGTSYNPMRRTASFVDTGGEAHAPNNLTFDTAGGPPIVRDFLMKDSGGAFLNAFHNPQSGTYSMSQTPTAMPAPDNFEDQSTGDYVGDKWPRLNKATSGTSWAKTVQEYLVGTTNTLSDTHSQSAVTGGGAFDEATGSTAGYGSTFTGYSMGPGYYGKTFWIWPPDPRTPVGKIGDANYMAGDWRKRFFTYGSSYATTSLRNQPLDDNSVLFDASGYIKQPSSTGFAVNYTAVLDWLKAGPKVLPDNLRSGRVLYYSAIPSSIPSSGLSLDQLFWKKYIDYTLGIDTSGTAGQRTFYGRETSGWGTVKITAKTSLLNGGVPNGTGSANTVPYMHYNDNPIRPRAHFWFGPLTMMMFLTEDNGSNDNMWSGTLHESQTWQLKAGVNAALDDIKKNHPNDWATLIFFSNESGFSTPRVQLSRNYTKMKNALFFPNSLLNTLGDSNSEMRPYNSSWGYVGGGDIPNARGGTCPEMGFKVAYNEFSGATGYFGRRGAAKVCILETDGVPNHSCGGTFSNGGMYNSKYTGSIGSTTSQGNNSSNATDPAVAVVTAICNLDTASTPGYSTNRSPARVHAIAFGDLFETTSSLKGNALDFLLRVQKAGKTSAPGDTSIESYKICTGNATIRILTLQQALERIMQSGIQVSLIHDNDNSTPD